ncbi:hypothetical protein O6H91_14G072500 [Diphasiastrum complanatum]|uniref:Uncharacterized protein n=1 Tax=Diphasiastrum complanatum TaxID=34168 RepID=A0ACC2BQP2_DIPCM|nr:hypothetical protein O6H91_14G072500 [Diphasiastrum complanatum]
MGYGNTGFESFRRAGRTAYFMAIMLGSLMLSSTPWFVCLGDILLPCALLSTFTCCTSCFSFRIDWSNYGFRSSLVDIPFISLVRSLAAICAYGVCDIPSLCYGPYLATTIVCGFVSGVLLVAKASVFSISNSWQSPNAIDVGHGHMKNVWGLPLMFLSSIVLALGHVVVAYRARSQARRRLFFHRADVEAVLICKLGTHAFLRQTPRASPRFHSKLSKDGEKILNNNENDLPASMLADADSMFMKCKGLLVHYKLFDVGTKNVKMHDCSLNKGQGFSHHHSFGGAGSEKFSFPMTQNPLTMAKSNGFNSDSLHAPLLNNSSVEINHTSSYDSLCRLTSQSDLNGWPAIAHTILGRKFQANYISETETLSRSPKPGRIEAKSGQNVPNCEGRGVIFIHGFGGGVFSWRHVMGPVAKQTGCTVAGFDRPGWGLTSRPSREEWEKKGLPNPYELHSQVDLILAFCQELGLKSVVLVGHDDGGMLALMTAAKVSQAKDCFQVSCISFDSEFSYVHIVRLPTFSCY